jgi:hypothetical protein
MCAVGVGAPGPWGGRCPSVGDYVAVTGTRGEATAAGGPFMLPTLLCARPSHDKRPTGTIASAARNTLALPRFDGLDVEVGSQFAIRKHLDVTKVEEGYDQPGA